MKKYLKFACCLLSLLLVLNVKCTYASGDILKINGTKNGMQLHLYKVANQGDEGYTYTDLFSDAKSTSIDLNHLETSENIEAAAETLKGFAATKTGSDLTANGDSVSYSSLTNGIYLILIDNYKSGDTTYNYLPLLIQFPETSEINLTKYSTSVLHKYSLVKHWSGGNNYPSSIQVDLYNGNTLEKTLTLTKENNYAYSWETTQDKNYSIKEHQVKGYSASVAVSEDHGSESFVLTNTKNPSTMNTNNTVPSAKESNGSSSTKTGNTKTSQTATKPTISTKAEASQKNVPSYSSKAVKTGDETKVALMITAFAIAGLALILIGRFLKN